MSGERVAAWVEAITARPELYRLTHYGPFLSVEGQAAYFARWEADEASEAARPALCRRCGRLLRETFRPHQQLHLRCDPPRP